MSLSREELQEKKRRRRERYIIIFTALLIIFFTLLETNISKLSGQIPIANNILVYGLININIILLLLLVFLVLRNVVKLFFERKRKILGSKLRTKLVVAFITLSLAPTLLLFFVAMGFIANSIENWFSIQVESSLQESLEVAKVYYQNSADNAIHYAKQLSKYIPTNQLVNPDNFPNLERTIKTKLEEYNLGAIEVFSSQGEGLVTTMNSQVPLDIFISSEASWVREALKGKEITKIQAVGKGDLIRGAVPIASPENNQVVIGAIVVTYYVPKSLVGKMNRISSAFTEYKQLLLSKNPIKTNYLITLSIVTLLIIFAATWFGFYLAKGIIVPIQELAEGTHKVANGDLDFHIDLVAEDELGRLVKSFNKMTQDLKASQLKLEEANIRLKESNLELERRRRYIETVLENVAAGVVSINKENEISTINKSAEKILNLPLEKVVNRNYQKVLPPDLSGIIEQLDQDLDNNGGKTVEKQIELSRGDNTLTLLVNATILRDENDNYVGLVLVLDDLTQLVKVQRMTAWREVARRIAHEIKNPLTPIQLSAQRLQKKYGDKFPEDGRVFEECTRTIINQVEELKNLVNEFSSFARLPAINPLPNNLNQIINETLILYQEAHKNIRFGFTQKNHLPIFDLDKEQMKRVVINLLDNAVSSIEEEGEITIETSYDPTLQMATLEIADTGCGIPSQEKPKLFEPYFSTKKSGTGLGLAIVNTIISDHNGYIRVRDNHPKGTRFIIELPVKI